MLHRLKKVAQRFAATRANWTCENRPLDLEWASLSVGDQLPTLESLRAAKVEQQAQARLAAQAAAAERSARAERDRESRIRRAEREEETLVLISEFLDKVFALSQRKEYLVPEPINLWLRPTIIGILGHRGKRCARWHRRGYSYERDETVPGIVSSEYYGLFEPGELHRSASEVRNAFAMALEIVAGVRSLPSRGH